MTRLGLLPNLIWSIFAISLAENPVGYVKNVLVKSNSGPVNGFVAQLSPEFAVDVFLRIPFAKPPIDDLRFEKPEPVEPWTTPLEAKSFSKSCWPHDLSGLPEDSFSDDCLYLNIIRPHDQSSRPESGWPVLVWIHGGGYSVGFSWYYGYQNISLNFVSQNLIVVTIQYRLGFSGFTSTGDEEMPGNLGYWDQTQAFKFLKENIAGFGGDPNNLVAFGLSAGGASTAALSISPASRDLISKSIEMSGAVFANWHASDQIIQVTEDLSRVLGCPPVTKSKNLKKCFKTKTAQEFLAAVKIIGGARKDVNLLKFHPRIDGDFFPVDFPQLIKESPPKPTMLGYTDQEAGYFTILGLSKSINAFYIPKESFQFYSLKNFTDFVETIIVPEKIFKSNAKRIQKEIIDFYVKNTDYKSLLKSYSDLMSDIWFSIPALWTARAKTEAEWPVYLYFNDYYNDDMFSDDIPVKGSMHANEYPYMFGKFAVAPFVFDENDWKVQRIIVDTIVEFTKTGNPSTKSFKWPSTNATDPFIHAFIRPNPVVGNRLQKEALKLWDRISKDYDFDIIRGIQKTTGWHKDEL